MQFLSDLLDVNYIKKQIDSSQLSTEYLPLTQLTSEAISAAATILNQKLKPLIERRMELEKLNKKENLTEYMSVLEQINKFSNEFYELIPQLNYNYEKLMPISTEKELNEQLCTLNKLNNTHIALRILMGAKQAMNKLNPFDYVYYSMNLKLELLDASSPETQCILRYIWCSNQSGRFRVKRIFKVEREAEVDRFDKATLASQTLRFKNHYLLWHGTSTENLISIMSTGLKIAPNEAKQTGQRFGKGVYFSDSFEASSTYSSGLTRHSTKRNYMLLCEVALGKIKELRTHHETLDSLPCGFDSVKALGRKEPDPNGDVSMPSGSIIPLGERVDCKLKPGEYRSIVNSQYVVYDEAQVVIRYVVQYYE